MGTFGVVTVSCKNSPKRTLACLLVNLYKGFQKGSWEGTKWLVLIFCSALVVVDVPTSLTLGYRDPRDPLGDDPVSRLRSDHWALGPRHWGTFGDEGERGPTIMGVGALERVPSWTASPYMPSRKADAVRICASEASVAARDAINEAWVAGCKERASRARYSKSRESCVRPRWDFDPSMVWLYRTSILLTNCSKRTMQTFPDPVTPNVATSPSLASPSTPSTSETIPVPLKISICSACSSNTLVKANFSTARFLESLGGLRVMCVGIRS